MAPSPCCVAMPLCVLDLVVNTPHQTTAKGPRDAGRVVLGYRTMPNCLPQVRDIDCVPE
jgi:hypothetical protein